MQHRRTLNAVTGRLSLRAPQALSLERLAQALEAAPEMLQRERALDAVLATLKAEFPTLQDFEREFPSLCFALATGVGKTRLMGAFISYLHLAYGVQNFFVLAPNLTIYEKLKADFTPNTPKYVFKGIAEFATNAPMVITGDDYDQRDVASGSLLGQVRINVFNISKINSEVRGGKEPRIKRMREVLGDSYFNHLAGLPDLVLLMDESHRYRASAGVRAINELRPLFGLELTATPFVESSRGPVPFRNVVVHYQLPQAMADGFVKEPAVVTQRNFDARNHTPDEVEKIKLEDGVRLHELTKVELVTYARENGVRLVKPFMLVIARDTTHAARLKELMESEAFHGGRYRGKVIQVDSSKTGADEEEMIRRLLAVESVDEPTEIVVHVNMLKEGWDVTNLYTIVPLRAANARTLIEQSIGRGLRLPYGQRTKVAAVDRLNIVAHDRFQEIIDEANKGDSPIKLQKFELDPPSGDERPRSIVVNPAAKVLLGLEPAPVPEAGELPSAETRQLREPDVSPLTPLWSSEPQREVARLALEVIGRFGSQPDLLPSSSALLEPEVQQAILVEVQASWAPRQSSLVPDAPAIDIAHVIARATEFDVRVSRGFTELRPSVFTFGAGQAVRNVRDTIEDPGKIKQMLFGGFERCLYPVQKFDSGTERRLALILEREALRWFKPAKGQFQIYYKLGPEEPEYVPDFVAETSDTILMIETKARDEMQGREVLAKADAALRWCAHASTYSQSIDRVQWKYLLVPHDAVNEAARLVDLTRFERKLM